MSLQILLQHACELLSDIDLDDIFDEQSVDCCWWKELMEVCIPKSTLSNRKSLPWMMKETVQAIWKRNYYFKKPDKLEMLAVLIGTSISSPKLFLCYVNLSIHSLGISILSQTTRAR